MNSVSLVTVALSALASIVSGYVGMLLNFRRQRARMRRMYGLAILSEIKSLERVFRQYHGVLGAEPPEVRAGRLPRLRLSTADLNVFGFNSGNIGLFSVRTAVEVIEFYSRVRALIAQAQSLADAAAASAVDPNLGSEIFEHLREVVLVRRHSRAVAALLRSELPAQPEDWMRYARRRARVTAMRLTRRVRVAAEDRIATQPLVADPTRNGHDGAPAA